MTTPTDPTTPTTPGTQTAAEARSSANGGSDGASAAPAARPEPASPRLGPAVALRQRLRAAIVADCELECPDDATDFVDERCFDISAHSGASVNGELLSIYVGVNRVIELASGVFADWLRSDEVYRAVFSAMRRADVGRTERTTAAVNALADLIDATVERSRPSAPVAAGATPPVGASTAGPALSPAEAGPAD